MEAFVAALFEAILPAIVEIVLNVWVHRTIETRRPGNVFAALAYIVVGGLAGWASTLLLPTPVFESALYQLLALLAAVLGGGFAASLIGRWRSRRGQDKMRIDQFGYGALIGFAFGLARLIATQVLGSS